MIEWGGGSGSRIRTDVLTVSYLIGSQVVSPPLRGLQGDFRYRDTGKGIFAELDQTAFVMGPL